VVFAVFTGVIVVDVLAISAVMFVVALYLCGPIAVILAYNRWHVMAVLIGAASCWLGIYFFVTIYTAFKYLGLFSAVCGLWAMYKAAQNIVVR
jgi:hypothetical protein